MSFSLTTFNRSGKLGQIDHALKAVSKGDLSLGIQATDGVVIATERVPPSVLVEPETIEKMAVLSDNVGMVYSGLGPDFRVLSRAGQRRAQSYLRQYKEAMPVEQLTRGVADVMQEYTQAGGVRAFGVSLMVAGWDEQDGPQLYQVDPSGTYFGWRASAIGRNFTNAKTFLEKRYKEDMALDDAIHTALLTLRESFEGEMTEKNIQLGIADKDGFRYLTEEEVRAYIEEAE